MNPLGRVNNKQDFMVPAKRGNDSQNSAGSTAGETWSVDGRYGYRPAGGNQSADNRCREELSPQTQSRIAYLPSGDQKKSCYSEDGKERFSVGKRNTCETSVIRVREQRFDELLANRPCPGQPKRQRVADESRSYAINRQITDAKDIHAIIAICDREIDQFNHVNIATACNQLAKLNSGWLSNRIESILRRLSDKAIKNISEFNAQALANTALAFANLGIRDDALFGALSAEAIQKIREFNTQNIATTALAFAKLGIQDEALFKALSAGATPKIRDFNTKEIANISVGFAMLGMWEEALFRDISREAVRKIEEFNASDFAKTAWSFAKLGIRDEALFKAISEVVKSHINDFNPRALADITWSFAALGLGTRCVFNLLEQKIVGTDLSLWKREGLAQLSQVAHHFQYELRRASFSWPKELCQQIRRSRIRQNKDIHSFRVHQDCSRILSSIGYSFSQEHEINGLVADIFLKERNIVILVDCPACFAANSKIPLGPSLFEERLFKAMGYFVMRIPYWEWYGLKDDPAKNRYLYEYLASVPYFMNLN